MKQGCKKWIVAAGIALLAIAAIVAILNGVVIWTTGRQIIDAGAASELDADCILVLGAGLKKNGEPGNTLADRLDTGIQLYEAGAAGKLLMSGDHGRESYDEVNLMKRYAMERGVPSEDIFMDHAGFSTYESVYRAKAVFRAERIVIVTQSYHLPRALFIANGFGLEAYGVSADLRTYSGMTYAYLREVAARVKDCFTTLLHPQPTYLGEAIPVSGNGDLTND